MAEPDWERIWHRLIEYAPAMTPQGREYMHLAQRLIRANRLLLEIPELEEDAYQEMQGLGLLLHSIGGPEEEWLVQLLALITHLIDMLYVRLEYVKWEVSPLSELASAIAEWKQETLDERDQRLLAFLSEYDAAVRSETGLLEAETLSRLQNRAKELAEDIQKSQHRRLRAMTDLVSKVLQYDPDKDWLL